MAVINVIPNGTPIPKIDPKLLEPDTPQLPSYNIDPESGNLQPLKGLLQGNQLTQSGDLRSIFFLRDSWLAWTSKVDVVKAQIADSDDRFFYTDGVQPRQSNYTDQFTTPVPAKRLGVDQPATPLTVAPQGTSGSGDPVVVSYVYTYVTAWGEESKPSVASAVTEIGDGQYVELTNFTPPSDSHIEYLRVYRIEVGTSGSAEYQLLQVRPGAIGSTAVWDIPAATISNTSTPVYDANASVDPDGLNDQLGEVVPSETWDAPPADLINLVQFQNGILAGSSGQEVCISEPAIPYAWPISFRKTLEFDVVALGVFKSTMVALTTGKPYLIQGSDPSRMSLVPLEYKQACQSKRGVISVQDGVIYPSPDGLFKISASSGAVITDHLFTKSQWNTPSVVGGSLANLVGVHYQNAYFGFFAGTSKGFYLTLDDDPMKLVPFDTGRVVYDAFVDNSTNTLWLLGYSSPNYYVYQWGAGSGLNYIFRSKTFVSYPTNHSVVQIKGDLTNGVMFILYVDGSVVHTQPNVTSEEFFRLADCPAYRNCYFDLIGDAQVIQVVIAHAPEELSDA